MDYVFVTLRTRQNGNVDLKIPTYVTIGELLIMLSNALNISIMPNSKLQAEPIGRILDNNKTLSFEGVETGAMLTLI